MNLLSKHSMRVLWIAAGVCGCIVLSYLVLIMLIDSRQSRRLSENRNNLLNIAGAINYFQQTHDEPFPRSLSEFGSDLIDQECLESPFTEQPYFYSGVNPELIGPKTVLVYDLPHLPNKSISEKFGPSEGCWVLIADGSVIWLPHSELLTRLESDGINPDG